MPITLTVIATVQTPKVPTNLRMSDGQTMPIEGVTDDGLRKIGEAWTEELIAKAHRRRALPTPQEDG